MTDARFAVFQQTYEPYYATWTNVLITNENSTFEYNIVPICYAANFSVEFYVDGVTTEEPLIVISESSIIKLS
jgi:hypothetical protein